MCYLSYPPEILQNIINDFDTWRKIFFINKEFNKIPRNILFARGPLQSRFGRWYFLAYLKLTRSIFKNNEEPIFNKIINSIPKNITFGIILELVKLILENQYNQIFDYFNLKINNIKLDQTNVIKILVNALITRNEDYFLFSLLSKDKKRNLKLELFKETLYTTQAPILQRLTFTRLENNGFKADAEVTLMFLENSELNLFDSYKSSLFKDDGVLLSEALKYSIMKYKGYNTQVRVIITKMKPIDVVISFREGYFDNLKSDALSYDLSRKFLDYSVHYSEFTKLIKRMIEKELTFGFEICRKIIMARKKKISFLLNALGEVTKVDKSVLKQKLIDSFKTLSEKRRKEMKERLEK